MASFISQETLGRFRMVEGKDQSSRPTPKKTGVFHIEDDPLWSDVTALYLEQWSEFSYVGTASSGRDGIAQCRAIKPTIVLLDLVLPDMSGLDVWDELGAVSKPPKILLFTCRTDEALLHQLAIGRAAGLIWKTGDFAEHLRPALAAVAVGGSYFPPDVIEAVRRFRSSPHAFHKALSPWELKLVTMLAHGRKDGDIAAETGCVRGTIRNHWRNIAGKLGLNDRHDLRAWAEAKGLGVGSQPALPGRFAK